MAEDAPQTGKHEEPRAGAKGAEAKDPPAGTSAAGGPPSLLDRTPPLGLPLPPSLPSRGRDPSPLEDRTLPLHSRAFATSGGDSPASSVRDAGARASNPVPSDAPHGDPAADGAASDLPFGRYRLRRELGRGGMGVVYEAWDQELRRPVALKTLLPQPGSLSEQVERFAREARAAARLRHPGIVQVYDVGCREGVHFFTMDFIEGRSLRAAAKELSDRRFLEVLRDIALALHAAHEAGIVHRDVKPANVLLDGAGRAYVTDFGLAKEVRRSAEDGITRSGAVLGTAHYMAPEQGGGETARVGPWSDVWSLGVILYERLAGRFPFDGESEMHVLVNLLTADVPAPSRAVGRPAGAAAPHVPPDLETICMKCLEREPERRYATAAALAQDLGRYLEGEPILARPVGGVTRLLRKARRHKGTVLSTGAASLLGLAGLTWALYAHAQSVRAVEDALLQARRLEGKADEAAGYGPRGAGVGAHATGRASVSKSSVALYAATRDAYREARTLDPSNAAATQGIERAEARVRELEARAAANRAEALRLLEEGRPALELAARYVYDPAASYAELLRRVEEGQGRIERAIELAPDLVLGRHLLGRAWELRGRDDEAERCWRAALAIDPDFGPARYRLGRVLGARAYLATLGATEAERQARRPEAERLAAEAQREIEAAAASRGGFENDLERCVAEAVGAYVRRDFAALERLTRAGLERLGERPGVEDLHWLAALGVAGDPRLERLNRAIALRPKFPLALLARGYERSSRGDPDGAIADYTATLEMSPFLPELWYSLGTERGRAKGDMDGALAALKRAVELRPAYPEAWNNLGNAHAAKGERQAALLAFSRSLELSPASAEAWNNRGNVRAELRDFAGARADYEQAIARAPGYAEAYSNRAATRAAEGDFAGAVADQTEALRRNPELVKAWFQRGLARRAAGDLPGAIADFGEAIQRGPRLASAWLERADARRAAGELDGALADADAARGLLPGEPSVLGTRGAVLLARGDAAGACADLEAALRVAPTEGPLRARIQALLEQARRAAGEAGERRE
ncbi:MAG: tetratricopeptide repeat protein [Planctomycetes bacterium]|nr:tetratricopeptide repeat protein [Planctomycetota bacterium]